MDDGIVRNLGVGADFTNDNRESMDWYATDPCLVEDLLLVEDFGRCVVEPCVGTGNIAEILRRHGHEVTCIDILDRGYPETLKGDYLKTTLASDPDIITNPPYKHSLEFVQHSLQQTRGKIAMLLKIQFLEGIRRYKQLHSITPPNRVYIYPKRVLCYKNNIKENISSAMMFTWMIWDRIEHRGHGTRLEWIDNTDRRNN